MKKILTVIVFQLFWAGCAYAQCTMESKVEVDQWANKLFIAKAMGDVPIMSDAYQKIDTLLNSCVDEQGKLDEDMVVSICDFDCHLNMAEYLLFMADDLKYYFAKAQGNTPAGQSDSFLEYAYAGERVLKRAISKLTSNSLTQEDKGFNYFLSKKARLYSIYIKLLMAMGDTFYQSVSKLRLEKLYYNKGEDNGFSSSMTEANDLYRQALWVLAEARLDIPDKAEGTGEDSFLALRNEFEYMAQSLKRRLRSVRRGHLFLDIDPDRFTPLTSREIEVELEGLVDQLRIVEADIEAVLKSWLADKDSQEERDRALEQREGEFEMTKKSYEIAKLQSYREKVLTDINIESIKRENELRKFQVIQEHQRAVAQIRQRISELDAEKGLIDQKGNIQLINVESDKLELKMAQIRWQIEVNTIKANLEIQLKSLAAEQEEYQRQAAANNRELKDTALEREAVKLEVRQAEAHIGELRNDIALLQERQTVNRQYETQSLNAQLCQLESRIKMLGGTPRVSACTLGVSGSAKNLVDYQTEICAARLKVEEQNITNIDQLLAVLDGQNTVIQDMKDREEELIEKRKSVVDGAIRDVNKQVEYIRSAYNDLVNSRIGWSIALQAAHTVHTITSAIPVILGSFPPGVEVDPSRTTGALVEQLTAAYEQDTQIKLTEIERDRMLNELNTELNRLEGELQAYDVEKALQSLSNQRLMNEIKGDVTRLEGERKVIDATLPVMKLTCDENLAELEGRLQEAIYEHQSLYLQLQLTNTVYDQLSYEIDSYLLRIAQEEARIAEFQVRDQQLNNRAQKISDDNASIRRLEQLVVDKITETRQLISRNNPLIENMDEALAQKGQLLANLRDATVSLTEAEKAALDKVIAHQADQEALLNQQLEGLLAKLDENDELYKTLQEFNDSSYNAIKNAYGELDELADKVSRITDEQQATPLLYLNRDQLASWLPGIPDFVRSKRRILELANYYLHLYKSRLRLVNSLSADTSDEDNSSYIRSYTELREVVNLEKFKQLDETHPIMAHVSRIGIRPGTALHDKLSRDLSAKIILSPRVKNAYDVQRFGHFIRWPETLNNYRNHKLVDLYLTMEFSDSIQCESQHVTLQHSGSGYIFDRISNADSYLSPFYTNTAPRVASGKYGVVGGVDNSSCIDSGWQDQRIYSHNFPAREICNDPAGSFPFMGLPLVASYDIEFAGRTKAVNDDHIREGVCEYNKATYYLTVVSAVSL